MRHRLLTALWIVVASTVLAHAQDAGPTAFKVDTLNAGLPAPPQRLDRSTPRATIEAFLSATGRGDYDRAAHLLDLDSVPAGAQTAAGPRLAEELAFVIRRKIPVDIAALPDRPDGMQTQGTERQPMVGVARKSLRLGILDLPQWPVTIRLNRVQVGEADPVWVFSRQSVEHIAELYGVYGPTALERALPPALLEETFWGIMWWELIALPLILLVAAGAAWLLWTLMTRIAERMPLAGVRATIERGRLPAALLAIGIILQVMVSTLFEFSARTDTTLSVIFWVLIVSAIVFGVSRTLDTIIDFTSNRYLATIDAPENTSARRWYTNLSAIKRLGVMFVVVVGVATALSSLRVFSSFGLSLLVSAGLATAVFGLAAQAVMGNIFASLQLALAKPIRIGDAVYYDGHWAYVERINYTYVQLRTWDLKRFIVPVKHFISNPFENWTMAEPKMIQPILLKLDHRTDVEALRQTFAEMAVQDPDWSQGEEPTVQVIDHDEDCMSVRFYCTADNPTSAWDLHCRLREKLLAHLREQAEPAALPRTRLAVVANTTEVPTGAAIPGAQPPEPRKGGGSDSIRRDADGADPAERQAAQ